MDSSAKEESVAFRVLTVNTHKGFTFFNRRYILGELRDAVRAVSADIVFLQEVLGAHETLSALHTDTVPMAPQYEFLADSMWTEFAYGRNAVYPQGHHGNALLSRFPIVHYQNHDVSIEGPEKRGMLHCQLTIPDRGITMHAVCVHLGLREQHRRHQLALLCDLVTSLPADEAVIVAGDFNDWRLKAERVLNGCGGLREVFMDKFGVPAKTFPARLPLLRLDRIYARGVRHHPVIMPNRPWAHLSDHAPLAAEITL